MSPLGKADGERRVTTHAWSGVSADGVAQQQ